jgi:PAS domain S-box-containing protein
MDQRDIYGRIVAELARDPAFAGFATPDAALLIWDAGANRLLGASPVAEHLRGAFSDRTGRLDPHLPARARLRALGAGLAPVAGLRLERLRLDGLSPPVTCACRRVMLDGEAVLVTALIGPIPKRASPSGSAASERATPETPEAPLEPAKPPRNRPWSAPSLETLRQRGTVRIVWQADAEGRFTAISPVLAEIVGPGAGDIVGRDWKELARTILDDPGNAIADLMDRRETWSGRTVSWSVDGTSLRIPTIWAGLPVYGADREFAGFRGFGLLRTDAAERQIAPILHEGDAAPSEQGAAADEVQNARVRAGSALVSREAERKSGAGSAAPSLRLVEESTPSDREAAAGDEENSPRVHGRASPERGVRSGMTLSRLSVSERSAFREIARALGARFSFDPEEPAGSDPAEDEQPAAEPATDGAADLPAAGTTSQPEDHAPPPSAAGAPAAPSQSAAAAAHADQPHDAQQQPDEEPAVRFAVELTPAAQSTHSPSEMGPVTDGSAGPPGPDRVAEDAPVRPHAPLASTPAESGAAAPADVSELRTLSDVNPVRPVPATPPVLPTPLHVLSAPARPAAGEGILERLPLAALVHRDERVLFANRALLDLVGCATLECFEERGGLAGLFAGSPPLLGAEAGAAPMALTTSTGPVLADVSLAALDWDEAPATLILIRPTREAEAGARLTEAEAGLASRERSLDEAQARIRELEAVLDTATDGVVEIDGAGRILSLNRAAEALFGYDNGEVVGEAITVLIAPESHIVALDYLEGLRSSGTALLLNDGREVVGRERQGGLIPLFMALGPVADGPRPRICAVLRDITAFKKAEGELIAAKRAAEAANAQKSDVLAKISHEIRTPLNAIIGFAEVMLEERFGPVGNERYKDYLKDVHASGTHVISLVNDLLDLAKIEAGRMDLSVTGLSLNALVAASMTLLQPQAARDRIVMRTSFAPNLPTVMADERSVRQIALNLLSNAIKFTDPGGQVIVSTAVTDRGEVAFRVRDTGIGMTEAEIAAALEPFRQLATARRRGGTGLGLPLTKALVEANQGALLIRSAPNEGTLVEVLFPPARVMA